jgi:hypothetical protein
LATADAVVTEEMTLIRCPAQWTTKVVSMNSIQELDTIDAEKVIESFRQGTVPTQYLELFSVGRDRWLASIYRDLDFVARGGSKVRFLSAPYGGGKTHFLMLVKARALSANALVSYVELHSREAPFDRFEVIFPKVMRGVTLPDGHGVEHMLEDWARQFPYYSSQEVEANLRRIAPSLDFRAALRACLQYANTDSPDHRMRMQAIVAWLQGYRITSELKTTGIRSNVTIANVSEILGSFLRFVRTSGYAGLVLLLDEAEAITSLAQSRKRDEANQNIRKLLDNADEHSSLYVLFATTPRFLTDPDNGAQSYPALWTRIRDVIGGGLQQASSRSTVIVLPPFDQGVLQDLASRIVDTHSRAYEWGASDYCNEAAIHKYVSVFLERSDPCMVRAFIRALVYVLDVVEEKGEASILEDTINTLEFETE